MRFGRPALPGLPFPIDSQVYQISRPVLLAFLRRPIAAHLTAVVLTLGVAGIVFAQTRSFGLLGMDTYPIIFAARIESLADFFGTFTERLMDGLYPGGFYRPLLNLSFAVDYALWGLDAAGYQLSNVLFLAGCGLALYGFLMNRGGGRSRWAALAGMLFFFSHPLLFEVVPYPPRRPELMCSMFMLLALTAAARGGSKAWIWSGSATLLALASKETALILPVLFFWQALIYSSPSGWASRGIRAVKAAAGSAVVVVAYIALRWSVLGDLGGHRTSRWDAEPSAILREALKDLGETVAGLLRTVTSPSEPGAWEPLMLWSAFSVAAFLAALSIGREVRSMGREQPAWNFFADLLFSAAWLCTLAVIFTASGRLSPWYFVAAVVAFSVLVAGIFDVLMSLFEHGGLAQRFSGLAGVVVVVWLASSTLIKWSPIFRSYGVWEQATNEYSTFVAEVEDVIQGSEDGMLVRIPRPSHRALVDGEESPFRGVVHLAHYSLHAWAQLALPDRQVRVLKNPRPLKSAPVQSTEVVVILDRLATRVKKTHMAGEE